jgi:nucleotide-binding universal stress UspA family protein
MDGDYRIIEGSTAVAGVRRVIVGVSGSPGGLPALRYAEQAVRRGETPLIAVHAWIPPGGDIAERRCPSSHLRKIWAQAALDRLMAALETAWGVIPADLRLQPVVVRGETGPALVDVANSGDDLLVVGAGRRGGLARICVTSSKAIQPGHGTSEPSPAWATGSVRRSALVDRMTGGERGTDLVGERDGQQSLLQ